MTAKRKKTVAIIAIVAVAVCAFLGYRIYSNYKANLAKIQSTKNEVVVSVGKPSRREIKPLLKLPATIDAAWSAQISSKVDGRIIRMNVNVGDRVTAGQVLCQLDTTDLDLAVLQAQSNLLTAQANYDNALQNFDRTKALYDQKVASQKEMDNIKALRDAAAGQIALARASLQTMQRKVDEATVIAPHDGVVVERKAQEGYYSKPGETLMTLADDQNVIVKKNVPEGRLNEIRIGMPVKITADALPGKVYNGQISRIYPSAVLPTRTYTSEATITNNDGKLHMGMSANVEISGAPRKNVLCIPESAIVLKGDQKTVYVVLKDNIVKQTLVEIGAIGDGWAEVLSGITINDTFVASGQNKINNGDKITIAGDGSAK